MHPSFRNQATYNTWIRALWGTAKSYGMSGDLVRDVVEQVSNQRSVKAMSKEQFAAWFKRIEEMYGEKPSPQRRKGATGPKRKGKEEKPKGDNIIEIATPEQLAKIRTFARNQLGWKKYWNEAGTECESISRVIEKVTGGRKCQIRLLTLDEARSTIEALKKIKQRKDTSSRRTNAETE